MNIEVVDDHNGFRFRLIEGDRATKWAKYNQFATMDGFVVATGHFLPPEKSLTIITAREFCELLGVK